MSDRGDFFSGLLIGGIVGFAAGILLAPASGQETRENIVKKGKELADEVKEKKDELANAVRERTSEIIKTLREKLPKTREVHEVLDQIEKEAPGVA
ncbi:MAG: YtxH domain-containing protein [Ignavibacteriales bacterium]